MTLKYINIEQPAIRYNHALKTHVQDNGRPSCYTIHDTEQEAIDAADLSSRACYINFLKIAYPMDLPDFNQIIDMWGYK